MKFGYQGGFLKANFLNSTNNQQLSYTFNNGVADAVHRAGELLPAAAWIAGATMRSTRRISARSAASRCRAPSAAITRGAGSRPSTSAASRFLPQTISFADTKGLPLGQGCVNSYKDITPRVGVACDVIGNGKTSVKVNAGRYLEAASSGNGTTSATVRRRALSTTAARNWTDTNKNYVADCRVEQRGAEPGDDGEHRHCSATRRPSARPARSRSFDTGLLDGWGVRPSDWGFGVSVQQQVLPRMSVEVSYTRRWLDNFTAIDNRDHSRATTAVHRRRADGFAAAGRRRPDDHGPLQRESERRQPERRTVANTSANDAYNTLSTNYGNQYQHYNGLLLNVSSRVRNGLTFQGGMNTGKTVSDNCEIRAQIPDEWTASVCGAVRAPTREPVLPRRHRLRHAVTALGSYTHPEGGRADLRHVPQRSGRAARGQLRGFRRAVIAAGGLGRPLSNAAPNATINLIPPGALYGDRVNELDFKIAKILKFGRTRTNVGIEIYNILNSAAVLTYNQNFNTTVLSGPGSWLQPTSVLQPRFVKLSATIDF